MNFRVFGSRRRGLGARRGAPRDAGCAPPPAYRKSRRPWLASCAVLWLCACPSRERLGFGAMTILSAGVINDPANKSLRFDLLKFGLGEFCTEMRRRGAQLKFRDEDPVIGRFFADSCQSEVIDIQGRQSFVVRYTGQGYGWTNLSQRLGFRASGLVEYAADFRAHDDALYIYFRPRQIGSLDFQVTMVESLMAQVGISLTQLDPNQLGRSIVEGQLKRGFTVIRYSDRGETEFALGIIEPGGRPFRPYLIQPGDELTLDNSRTEVHANQQDFVGGFHVSDDDQELRLLLSLDGAPQVDVLLISKQIGDLMLPAYVGRPGPAALIGAAIFGQVLTQGRQLDQRFRIQPGDYYLLLDHSNLVGQAFPPVTPFDDRAARIDYLIQLDEAD